jgi:hypothetical protein
MTVAPRGSLPPGSNIKSRVATGHWSWRPVKEQGGRVDDGALNQIQGCSHGQVSASGDPLSPRGPSWMFLGMQLPVWSTYPRPAIRWVVTSILYTRAIT